MTSTMYRSVMLTVLMHLVLVSPAGVLCVEPGDGAPLQALDPPWHDELCCESPTTHFDVPETNRSRDGPRCSFSGLETETRPRETSDLTTGTCWDIMCRIDENWETLTCDLKSTGEDAGVMAVSLQRLSSHEDAPLASDGQTTSVDPVLCEAEDSLVCSVALDTAASFITVVTVGISDTEAPPIRLRVPARPVKPSPPSNLSHIQTIEAQLILLWDDPSDSGSAPLRYEVRYSFSAAQPAWQVVPAAAERRLSLDLKPTLNYTLQVRCSGLDEPPLWSDWSEGHHIFLHTVSYIPEKVVVHAGDDVTVYCVFNDHGTNASAATWVLNFQQPLLHSQYRAVNQRVSQITVRPSETRMYDLLQCTREWNSPYSQIYVEGASIDINCVTNGDIDAMDCSWKNTQWTEPKLQSRWADLPCDVMEDRDRAGEDVGEMGSACQQIRSQHSSCSIHPLRMSCYKLWLEVASQLGPIRSKPVYLSPIDHVKPHPRTQVKAVTQSSGVLQVTWETPSLPVEGLQCELQYHSLSLVRGQPGWKVQSPVRVARAEVAVPDMCQVYAVQVRCMHIDGTGYWSEWSDSVYSAPNNSRAPERGPNFWRVLQDEPNRNQTNVTLLLKDLPVSGRSYCVDGFIVHHKSPSGAVASERIQPASSHSFEWNRAPQTVSVEAYNSRGGSAHNTNMTLEPRPKRRCVRSFSVLVINSTSVSVSWTLLDNSSVPVSMVVQWTAPQRQQGSDHYKAQSEDTWVRLPYTERPVQLRGDFFGSEEYGFSLYPVFGDGEGEPAFTTATRGDAAGHVMLIVSFLSVVLLVALILSQNHRMKKFVWRDVPNPNKCSWAKGLDLKKKDTLDLFGHSEGVPSWSLLLPSEDISRLVIVDRADLTTALVQTPLPADPATALPLPLPPGVYSGVDRGRVPESELLLGGAPPSALHLDALTSSHPRIDESQPVAPQRPGSANSSACSSVTYSTVLLSDPKQEQPAIRLHYSGGSGGSGGSGSSSSDEGNFSANNSDISGSFAGGLWELDDPRRSCSYNSVEELSETSEQEDEGKGGGEKDLYYLRMGYPAEEEESEEEEQQREEELRKKVVLKGEECRAEARPLLGPEDSRGPMEPPSVSTCGFSPLYLPQFRTAPCTRQLQDSEPPL